ncbi:hypothetical protein KJ713_02780 [Patescibacteria group bacterium]|nr:hypothetical protein [Patescibacteria group bacterium]
MCNQFTGLSRAVQVLAEGESKEADQKLVVEVAVVLARAEAGVSGGQLPEVDHQGLIRLLGEHPGARMIDRAVVAIVAFCPQKATEWITTALRFVAEETDVYHHNYWDVSRGIVLGSFRAMSWLNRHSDETMRRDYAEALLQSLGKVIFYTKKAQPSGLSVPTVELTECWERQLSPCLRAFVVDSARECSEQVRRHLQQWSQRLEPDFPNRLNAFGEFVVNGLFYALISKMSVSERLSLVNQPSI